MATYTRFRRSVTSRYNPFSQSRYSGTYPLGSAGRGFHLTPNSFSPWLLPVSNSLLFPRKSESNLYQDRRLWHPLGANRPAVSKTEFIPRIIERRPWRDPGPNYPLVDPRGVPQKLVPSKIDPSGWTYIADKPGVLDKWRLGYEDPWKVIICLKRKMRQEVMHALGYAGKPHKKPKFNQYSYVRCF